MNKEQIKSYLIELKELDLLDFYNTIVCEYGSIDDMIYINNKSFFETQFVTKKDSELSKINPQSKYNPNDKYIRMIEYKKLDTSNELIKMIDLNILVGLVFEYFDEVFKMGLIN